MSSSSDLPVMGMVTLIDHIASNQKLLNSKVRPVLTQVTQIQSDLNDVTNVLVHLAINSHDQYKMHVLTNVDELVQLIFKTSNEAINSAPKKTYDAFISFVKRVK